MSDQQVPYDPATNLSCVALREAGLDTDDSTWAMRWELDEDGTARPFPLTVATVEAWAAARWEDA